LVAFESDADNLSSEDNNAFRNIFAREVLGAPRAASAGSNAPPPPDTIGPAITARGNGTIRVSRHGRFRLFCGRFAEPVTGTCGAASTRRARRVAVPRRSFTAGTRAPAIVRFRLSRASLGRLKTARKLRMSGIVVARDALGNATSARFRFTLKAPAAQKSAR
jgi:hypothetical protein